MPRRWHPVDPLEPVDVAVRDALRRAREKRDENAVRLALGYDHRGFPLKTKSAGAPLERPPARPTGSEVQ